MLCYIFPRIILFVFGILSLCLNLVNQTKMNYKCSQSKTRPYKVNREIYNHIIDRCWTYFTNLYYGLPFAIAPFIGWHFQSISQLRYMLVLHKIVFVSPSRCSQSQVLWGIACLLLRQCSLEKQEFNNLQSLTVWNLNNGKDLVEIYWNFEVNRIVNGQKVS